MIWAWEGAKPHMASNTTNDQPQPAATEAAMSEGELSLLGALHAYFRGCDLMRSRATFDEVRDVIERYGDGYRLIAAAPTSGSVVVDQVAACGEVHDIIARHMDLGDMPTGALDDMVIEIVEAVAALADAAGAGAES